MFRAGIALPAEVPAGIYDVNIKLFADSVLWVGDTQTAFEIVQVGFEQFIATAAHQHGLATAPTALMTGGWIASIVERRG